MIIWILKFGITLGFFASMQCLYANEITVFDVRHTLPMTDEQTTYRDFYVNAGPEVGLKAGLIITVVRRQAVYDAFQNKSPGSLDVPVGELKIIHSQKGVSVARLHSIYKRDNLPVLDYEYVMIGDRLDMKTARLQPSKTSKVSKSQSRRSASVKKSAPTEEPEKLPENLLPAKLDPVEDVPLEGIVQ